MNHTKLKGILCSAVVLFSSAQLVMAGEVLLVCEFDKECNSANECQPLNKPVEYKVCAMLDQDYQPTEQGFTIWGAGLAPTTGGTVGSIADYSGVYSDKANPNELSVLEWKMVDRPEGLENKYTLLGESLMGASGLFLGDPRADSSLPVYTGFCWPIYEQPCEVPE